MYILFVLKTADLIQVKDSSFQDEEATLGAIKCIRERGSVLYLGMAQEFWDFAKLAIQLIDLDEAEKGPNPLRHLKDSNSNVYTFNQPKVAFLLRQNNRKSCITCSHQ